MFQYKFVNYIYDDHFYDGSRICFWLVWAPVSNARRRQQRYFSLMENSVVNVGRIKLNPQPSQLNRYEFYVLKWEARNLNRVTRCKKYQTRHISCNHSHALTLNNDGNDILEDCISRFTWMLWKIWMVLGIAVHQRNEFNDIKEISSLADNPKNIIWLDTLLVSLLKMI